MAKEDERLTPREIGDNLDLEIEATYPCSDGSITSTISVDKLLQAQLAKAEPIIRVEERERIGEWLEKYRGIKLDAKKEITLPVNCAYFSMPLQVLEALKQGKKIG